MNRIVLFPQFGADKDVFASRFARNAHITFYHLYKCGEEEKSKIIRVLNLWQKNAVFTAEVISPLFDLANPNSELARKVEEQVKAGLTTVPKAAGDKPEKEDKSLEGATNGQSQQSQQSPADAQMTQQLTTILELLKTHVRPQNEVKFNKKLLDNFDYSDDEDDGGGGGGDSQLSPAVLESLQSIMGNPAVLGKLKSMGAITDQQIQQLQQLLPQATQQQQQQQQQQQPQAPPPLFQQLPPVPQPTAASLFDQIRAPLQQQHQQQQQQPPPALPGLDPQTAATVMAQYQQQQQQMHQQQHHHHHHQQQQQQQQHPAWMPMGPPQPVNSHGQFGAGDLEEGERAETDEDIQVGTAKSVGIVDRFRLCHNLVTV